MLNALTSIPKILKTKILCVKERLHYQSNLTFQAAYPKVHILAQRWRFWMADLFGLHVCLESTPLTEN